jgi:hypothetical protein
MFVQTQLKKCGWLNDPPLVCAHGGDSINAFPNTVSLCFLFLKKKVKKQNLDIYFFGLRNFDMY